jgi:predicted RND superfamily exporter protein
MHNDDESWYKLPEDRELAAQYLLLYEMSLPFGLDLNDRINIDKSSSRLTVTLTDMTTAETHAFIASADNWIKKNLPDYMHIEPTGATVMFSRIFTRNTQSMLAGNILAISMITIMLMLTLGSFQYGLLSIIPNTIPILVTFGIWALIVGEVGLAAAGVTATALGIIVDDTVHFLTKFLRARRDYGYSKADSIHYAFKMVGSALLANSVILISGFAVLAYSAFKINNQMGLLTALAIAVALIMDFLLLPALLMLGKDTIEESRKNQLKNTDSIPQEGLSLLK